MKTDWTSYTTPTYVSNLEGLKCLFYYLFLRKGCDPVGTQTQDLQNRNLTLYSTELRGQYGCEFNHLFRDLFLC